MTSAAFTSLTLPNGAVLPNRLAKAAMEENMADQASGLGQVPGERLVNLYRAWADGGVGTIITGNVMVDPRALTGPGGVVLEQGTLDVPEVRARFERWAEAAKSGGAHLVMQISHPGRQIYAAQMSEAAGVEAVSASATKLDMGSDAISKLFAQARALTGDEIRGLIRRFAETALAAKSCGFDGVEVHAAHGYLLAQFLSPLANRREDEWGGSLHNRARFLLEIVRSIRDRVGADFTVAVKLNSADFQKGGFDVGDAKQVVEWLNGESVDFVEVSGGTYESAAMMGESQDGRISQSTVAREAYFLDFAADIASVADMPVMVTGGITRRDTVERVLGADGVELAGVARALIITPDLPNRWKAGEDIAGPVQTVSWKNPALRSLANMALAKGNLARMADGQEPKARLSPVVTSVKAQVAQARMTKRYKSWLESLGQG